MDRLSDGAGLLLDACGLGGRTVEAVAKVGPRFKIAERGRDEDIVRWPN